MQQAPTEPMLSTDEETRQSKCMRLHSPPQPARRTSAIPRASSAVLPSRVNYRSILCATCYSGNLVSIGLIGQISQ